MPCGKDCTTGIIKQEKAALLKDDSSTAGFKAKITQGSLNGREAGGRIKGEERTGSCKAGNNRVEIYLKQTTRKSDQNG